MPARSKSDVVKPALPISLSGTNIQDPLDFFSLGSCDPFCQDTLQHFEDISQPGFDERQFCGSSPVFGDQ
jgi:hypothetical protein